MRRRPISLSWSSRPPRGGRSSSPSPGSPRLGSFRWRRRTRATCANMDWGSAGAGSPTTSTRRCLLRCCGRSPGNPGEAAARHQRARPVAPCQVSARCGSHRAAGRTCGVSAVSAWEIAVKRALGKLDLKDTVEQIVTRYGFLPLPATVRHGDLLPDLPLHHADPFDRLLIVQALDEGLTILTSDRAFEPYRVPVEWV